MTSDLVWQLSQQEDAQTTNFVSRLKKKDVAFALIITGLIVLIVGLIIQKFSHLNSQLVEQTEKVYEHKLSLIEKQAELDNLRYMLAESKVEN